MPVTYETLDENTKLCTLTHPWNTQQLIAHYAAMKNDLDASPHMLDVIFDIGSLGRIPLPRNVMQQVKHPFITHPNCRWVIVVVRNNIFLETMARASARFTHSEPRTKIVATLEEAKAVLREEAREMIKV